MLKMIERNKATDREIWKSSDVRTGVVAFYGIRQTGAKDKPFESTHPALHLAREALVAA